ncbi:MAG: hypothetical protein K9I96_01465 [Chlorobium sp.]|nr:hypothetical protein [Chlorobium sp.]MCF8215522.1 hypothetical protein [Chlorobium sp.]MCF8384475.1 hypothetical protein [Chlorobium sp.]
MFLLREQYGITSKEYTVFIMYAGRAPSADRIAGCFCILSIRGDQGNRNEVIAVVACTEEDTPYRDIFNVSLQDKMMSDVYNKYGDLFFLVQAHYTVSTGASAELGPVDV